MHIHDLPDLFPGLLCLPPGLLPLSLSTPPVPLGLCDPHLLLSGLEPEAFLLGLEGADELVTEPELLLALAQLLPRLPQLVLLPLGLRGQLLHVLVQDTLVREQTLRVLQQRGETVQRHRLGGVLVCRRRIVFKYAEGTAIIELLVEGQTLFLDVRNISGGFFMYNYATRLFYRLSLLLETLNLLSQHHYQIFNVLYGTLDVLISFYN